ncbi:MAG: hypothetical protein Q4A16_02215 [Lautropia sp.]|nr:hypothetical protein [Lautropia sp.]
MTKSTPSTTQNAAAKVAAQTDTTADSVLNRKAAKVVDPNTKVVDEAEQKLAAEAATEATATEAVPLATTDDAVVGGVVAAEASGASAAGATAAAGSAATVSPLAIGAGILGVAAIAAAGGGSSGNSNSSNGSNQIAQNPDSNKPSDDSKPVDDAKVDDSGSKADGGDTQTDDATPADDADPAVTPTDPVEYGPAVAQGTADAPEVAVSGDTQLSKAAEAFEAVKAADQDIEFIRITRVQAAESEALDERVVRYGDDDGAEASGQALSAPVLKDPAAPADSEKLTAYEVIKVEGGITLADAQARAEAMGGKLMNIDDVREASWVGNKFGPAFAAAAWIGGNAHEGDGKFNATVATGEDNGGARYAEISAETKLDAFVVEFNDYQWPLFLQDGDKKIPVVEGYVLNKESFDKLVWNSDTSRHGAIHFEVVNSDGENPTVVPGSKQGKITISESADVKPTVITPQADEKPADSPAAEITADGEETQVDDAGSDNTPTLAEYPAEAQTAHVAHDATITDLASLFLGTSSENQPEFIKITAVEPNDLTEGAKSPLTLVIDEGESHEVADEFILHKSNFDKLVWDASTSTGGEIVFIQVADAAGTPIPGATQQTITIVEASAPPSDNHNPGGGGSTEELPPDEDDGKSLGGENQTAAAGNESTAGGQSDDTVQTNGEESQQTPDASTSNEQNSFSPNNQAVKSVLSVRDLFAGDSFDTGTAEATGDVGNVSVSYVPASSTVGSLLDDSLSSPL